MINWIKAIQEYYIKFEPQMQQLRFDITIGVGGYLLAIQARWIEDAHHIITGVITALLCCAGVHYLKKILNWLDVQTKVVVNKTIKKWWKKLFK